VPRAAAQTAARYRASRELEAKATSFHALALGY
jgi:hypothetical protein